MVLAVVKPEEHRIAPRLYSEPVGASDRSRLRVTSDIDHEAANVEPDLDDLAPEQAPSDGPVGSSLPQPPFTSGTFGARPEG